MRKGGALRRLPVSGDTQSKLAAVGTALAAPVVTRIAVSSTGTVYRTRASVRPRSAKASATSVALRTSSSAGRTAAGCARARPSAMLVRTRSTSTLGAVGTDETRQFGLCLPIPDAVGTSSRLLVAHRLDVRSIPAYKLPTGFLCATRTPAIRRAAPRRGLEPSIVIAWTPGSTTGSRGAVESRPFRPGTIRVWTVGTGTIRVWTVCVRTI